MQVDAILFDKDGTLFDFEASWAGAMHLVLAELADGERHSHAAEALGFDLKTSRFRPDSVAIAGTASDIADALCPVVGKAPHEIGEIVDRIAVDTEMVPVVDLAECLGALGRRCPLGIVTNDSVEPASRHLREAGVLELFSFISGYDSGYGVKPEPGPLLAAAEVLGTDPAAMLMVGDSVADLRAGQAAGMRSVAVLTGVAGAEDLGPFAEVVLPDIGHLEGWLDRR